MRNQKTFSCRDAIKATLFGTALGLHGILAVGLCGTAFAQTVAPSSVRERVNIDDGWRFAYGHAYDASKDFGHGTRTFFFAKAGFGDGPADQNFDDRAWRKLDLPHDWAVELPFDSKASTNHGSKAVGRAFPENSVGWYRRELDIPVSTKGKRVVIEFDGVFRDSVVWVNGHYIGREASGYSSFQYDITDYLNFGGKNVIAVRVDATGEEGWWYEGAGIYRHVWMTTTSSLHVAQWGTFVRSEVNGQDAMVTVSATVKNEGTVSEQFVLDHQIVDPAGKIVAQKTVSGLVMAAATEGDTTAQIPVENARLWSIEAPQMYRLVTVVRRGDEIVDRYETPFGIRTIHFDPDQGFSLNGKPVKLHGTNNHQDHAGVGVALPDGLQEYRLRRLKDMGANAYRASHHPPTPEFLDTADRLGMLVIDEHRMMGTTPQVRSEMERMVRRDRNHPSVILWSVGNEEWAIENGEVGTRLARAMQADVLRWDPTRSSTLAASSSGAPEGTSVGSAVIGFNYKAQHDIDAMHRRFPDRPMLVTEEGLTYATRGAYSDDPSKVQIAAYDKRSGGERTASIEEAWRFNAERPFLSGMFVWTGFDYRGETTPFGWPAIGSQFGMLDTTGVMKDSGYYLKAAWTSKPMVHVLPHWNWDGQEGKPIDVRVYANVEEVELLLNGKSLGRKPMTRYSHLQWQVPYAKGTLEARGFKANKRVVTETVETTGSPVGVKLTPDRAIIRADGHDIAVLTVNVTDAKGRIVPTADNKISFSTTGPIRILGMGNGDPGSHEADKPAPRYAFSAVRNWRMLGAATLDDAQKTAREEEGAGIDPFQSGERDPRETQSPYYIIRAQFDRPRVSADEKIELVLHEFAPGQQVLVNGVVATVHHNAEQSVAELRVNVLKDVNTISYVFKTPEGGVAALTNKAQNGDRWGTVRITTLAAPWQRSAFNGYAQIIVQSTGEQGKATISATGQSLKAASVTIEVEK